MTLVELFILAVGLSMDAMAVSICKGLSVQKLKLRHAAITGLYFGGFQAGMPLIGYFLGRLFYSIAKFDNDGISAWVSFILLGLIGANMIKESLGEAEECDCSFGPKAMLPMAVATSVDALLIGLTWAGEENFNITAAISFIGVITFILSMVGVYVGNLFGSRYKSKAELTGGIVLILMGCKKLLEHLGVLDWFFGLFA